MEHKLTLGQLKSIGRERSYDALLAFFRVAVPDWDAAQNVDASGIRVSERLWQWVLSRMAADAKFGERESIGMTFVNIGPGSDSDLTGATVRVQDDAITY